MRVIRRDVVLLRVSISDPLPGEKEKFDYLDIWRQRFSMNRLGVFEIGKATEQTVDHRSDEAAFEIGTRRRLLQRERRKNGQMDRRIGNRASKERIDDVIGLAEAEGQPHDQRFADLADDVVDDRFRIGKDFGHGARISSQRVRSRRSPGCRLRNAGSCGHSPIISS